MVLTLQMEFTHVEIVTAQKQISIPYLKHMNIERLKKKGQFRKKTTKRNPKSTEQKKTAPPRKR